MIDFFKFKSRIMEDAVPFYEQKKKNEKLEKDADDPCWDGYVQLGTKMKDGKEVPNCVPMEEARKQMKNESASYEDDIDPNKKIVVKGTKGMNSKKFTKTFRNMKAADKWMDDNEDDIEIKQVMNESVLNEGVKVRHDRYKRTHGKNASGKGTWTFTTRSFGDPSNNEIYMGKSNQSVKDAAKDAAKALGSDEVYVMESAASLSEQAQSGDREAYKKFFNAALKRFGADSIADMDDDKKKEFFTYVDKNWESEDEKNESVQIDEKTVPLNKLKRGGTYTVNMGGKKGKVKVDSIRIDGGDVYVKMTYMDNNIGKKGETDTRGFDQGGDDDVFMERYK